MKRPKLPYLLRPGFNLPTALALMLLVGLFNRWRERQMKWIEDWNEMRVRYWPQTFKPLNAPWPLPLFGEPGVQEMWIRDGAQQRVQELFPEAMVKIKPPNPNEQP